MSDEKLITDYNMKINAIVFDLDETIGHFTQLYCVWDSLNRAFKNNGNSLDTESNQELFNELLETLHDYMRPFIFKIFHYLIKKKESHNNIYVMIYTNNNGPKQWTIMIKEYIHHSLKYELFDNVICAFKVDGKVIEPCRTTYNKTYNDLVRCASLPDTAQIFFIDDQHHERMKHEHIYYIKIKPYVFEYDVKTIIKKIEHNSRIKSLFFKHLKTYPHLSPQQHYTNALSYFTSLLVSIEEKRNVVRKNETEEDTVVGKQILKHLKDFFIDVIEPQHTKRKSRIQHVKQRTRKKYFKN